MKRSIAIYVLLALQVAGLVALYGYHAVGLSARTVRLRCVPVDPRDLLRGDFVILRYEISRVPPDGEERPAPEVDFPVFVSLKPDGEFWGIDNVSITEPAAGTVYLRATRHGEELLYGLERFYVPEGRGNPPLPITVELAVRPDGRAQIKRLFSAGAPWPPPR